MVSNYSITTNFTFPAKRIHVCFVVSHCNKLQKLLFSSHIFIADLISIRMRPLSITNGTKDFISSHINSPPAAYCT